MRLQVMSDLHFEFYPDYGKQLVEDLDPEGVDVLVIAGDTFNLSPQFHSRVMFRLDQLCEKGYPNIVYVPGNHEYWYTSPEEGKAFLHTLEGLYDPLVVLEHGTVRTVNGQRFLGDTMWFPYNASNWKFERNMPDFKRIQGLNPWAYREHDAFRDFLEANLQAGDVVVTHHSCSHKSVPDQFRGSSINRFFVAAKDKIIEERQPALWVHGHTHTQFDYRIGDTRVLVNPRGYPGEESQDNWDPRLIVELP